MNIAICEDSLEVIGELERIVYDCFEGESEKLICSTYLSGEELLKSTSDNQQAYQIYFLDIELKEINGLEVAASIRKYNHNAIIIFVTSHRELMQEAFEVFAFHYIIKPINVERVKQILLRALETLATKKVTFHYKTRKRINTLFLEQIEYFESYKRKVFIHTKDHIHEYYGSLVEVSNNVDSRLFVQIHNSYVVNMDYIKYVDASSVVLISDITIPITKKYYKDFNTTYRNYILLRML